MDSKTKWTEGLNRDGIAIISTATAVIKDEKESTISSSSSDNPQAFASPGGKTIRNALLLHDLDEIVKYLVDDELIGNSVVFNKDRCVLIESTMAEDPKSDDLKFVYATKEISKSETVVRTNHGILIEAGYTPNYDGDIPNLKDKMAVAYKSSVERMNRVIKELDKIEDARDMLAAISTTDNKKAQLNPVRFSSTHSKSVMVTTGQIMMVPSEMTLSYRPVWCYIDMKNINNVDSHKTDTYFQLLSARVFRSELISFKEFKKKTIPA